jgi:hypothetical protein
MTILYNQNTKQLSKFYENGYNLPIREPYMHELEVVDIQPTIEKNQWLTSGWIVDLDKKQYVKVYTVHTKTAYQLACEEWLHMDYAIRIVAPKELALAYPEIYVWFQVNDFPIEKREGQVLLYCNEVLPQHQPLIDAIESIYVEKRPIE